METVDQLAAGALVETRRYRVAMYHTPLLQLVKLSAVAVVLAACSDKSPTQTDDTPPPTTSRSTLVPTANSTIIEARTSQITGDGTLPAIVADDFRLTSASTIRTIRWQGIYCVQAANAAAPAPTASAFRITFYADASGRPNVAAPLQTSTYTLAQVAQTFDKNVSGLNCGTAANTTWPYYSYSTTLATPFAATANTKYWISIQAITPSYSVFWGWRDGVVDNSQSWQIFNGTFTSYAFDRAYSLNP